MSNNRRSVNGRRTTSNRRPTNARHPANTRRPSSSSRSVAKRKGSSKRGGLSPSTIKTIITIFGIIVAVTVVGIVAKSVVNHLVDSPKSVIQQLENSYNDKSVKEMIECFDPSTQITINMFVGVTESIIGIDSIIDIADGLLKIGQYVDNEDFEDIKNSKVDIIINNIDKNEDRASVDVTIRYYDGNRLVSEEDDTIQTVKVDGEWYIDGSGLLDELM